MAGAIGQFAKLRHPRRELLLAINSDDLHSESGMSVMRSIRRSSGKSRESTASVSSGKPVTPGQRSPTVYTDEELRALLMPTLLLVGEREVIYSPRSVLARA